MKNNKKGEKSLPGREAPRKKYEPPQIEKIETPETAGANCYASPNSCPSGFAGVT